MDIEIPQDVRDAVHANHKIEAIKLLRQRYDLGLKEAKQLVDEYTANNAHLITKRPQSDGQLSSVFIIVGLAAAVIYAAYRLLT